MKKNTNILISYLNLVDIQIDKDEFEYQLSSHPEFPNTLSYSDTLNFFNINCSVYEINKKDIVFLPENFISIIDGEFKLEFKNKFILTKNSKFILLVEKSDSFYQEKKTYNLSLYSTFLLALVILSVLLINSSFLFIGILFLLFSFSGIFLSFEAYKKTHGKGTIIPLGVCQNKMLKTDCDYVFNYKKWKFFDLSEISLSFFFSQVITFVILSIYGNLDFYYYIYKYIFFLFIPISIVSLYYQVIIIKKLCPVCIGIIFCVYAQLTLLYFLPKLPVKIHIFSIILYILFVLISLLFLLFLKKTNEVNNKLKNEIIRNIRFRKNYVFFKNNLFIQKKTLNDKFLSSFAFGAENSNLIFTLVTNPFCKYCKEFYPIFMKIIDKYGDKIDVRLVLDADLENFSEELRAIYINLACIYENSKEKNIFFIALEEWYNIRVDKIQIEKWNAKYSHLIKNRQNVIAKLENQKKWRKINDINYTPDIFINGYQYPIEYERVDLEYFLPELIEDFKL
ncbi:hypothetical protein BBI01_19780 [Chryseobacterium artocarpi]|uniref:Thioredoxin-like fold domain-containing protein n=1 Tax=Chryseobacterium artocarpi TaxID=1414727 RepID=A0A1B8Z939_9FLAO|nr:thioredoxin domain-containing protein [Chryseobacterium artocarpi]OCA68085.1 hypothetical protein BBI01_19780 [Chryseobacterium artocarpi]